MTRNGFTYVKTEEIEWPDCTTDKQRIYEMDLAIMANHKAGN